MTTTVELLGAFDLARSVSFGFGQREAGTDTDVMRLAFLSEPAWEPVGVCVRQPAPGRLEIDAATPAVAAHALRVLSADLDARGWDALGGVDPVIGRLQAVVGGLRPPLFHSAYEALCWCVLSARRPPAQGFALRGRLNRAYGTVVTVDGAERTVLPGPEAMLAVTELASLPEFKLRRLHGVARAALDGRLDTVALRALDPAQALARLRTLEGIGPFYAELVLVRALGHTDVLPTTEPTLLALAGDLLADGNPLTPASFAERAAAWSPWRTWAAVAIRAAASAVTGTVRGPVQAA